MRARAGGNMTWIRQGALLALILLAGFSTAGQEEGVTRSLTVTFDYYFGLWPACSATVTQKCIKQFNVYDVSAGTAGQRTRLFVIPVDPAAKGLAKGITGTSPVLLFKPGKHWIAVVAQTSSDVKSELFACVAGVQIK
jgi:hypothetical protein